VKLKNSTMPESVAGSQIPTPPSASTSDHPISTVSAAPTSSPHAETSEKTYVQKKPVQVEVDSDDDFDTVSLGSD